MLEGLDSFDWPTLSHAYGSARDVPALLRTISNGGRDASTAIYELFGNIWHQGTVYEATAPAVPFIGELARSTTVAESDRVQLMMLLFVIARGRSDEDGPAERCRIAVCREAAFLLDELSHLSGRLWVSAASMIAVAGAEGAPFRPLPPPPPDTAALVSTGLALIEDVLTDTPVTEDQLSEVKDLDAELAHYLDTEPGGRLAEDGIGAFFIELLVERMCDSTKDGAP
jgi:hypothetical protein